MAIMMPNSINYMVCLTGAAGVGVVVTTVNPGYTPSEVARQLKMSKATCALTNSEKLPVILQAIDSLGNVY